MKNKFGALKFCVQWFLGILGFIVALPIAIALLPFKSKKK